MPPLLRRARLDDVPALKALMNRAIRDLQTPFLSPAQIDASFEVMGLDTQLVEDGTYFAVELDGALAGCGGWSRRATLFGGDHSAGRSARLLDPAHEPARVRAMYVEPAFARRGVGRAILEGAEAAARAEGFTHLELAATLAGEPLYRAYGFETIEPFEAVTSNGVAVPLIRMGKAVAPA